MSQQQYLLGVVNYTFTVSIGSIKRSQQRELWGKHENPIKINTSITNTL
jgi:hypothetical protein